MTDLPILPATLALAEVHAAAGAMSEHTLRKRLHRLKAMRRYGNNWFVDSATLASRLPEIHAVVIRNRMLTDVTTEQQIPVRANAR